MSVYLKAAELIYEEQEDYSCWAIAAAVTRLPNSGDMLYGEMEGLLEVKQYARIFKPKNTYIVWWGDFDSELSEREAKELERKCRINALVFMHEIVTYDSEETEL